MGEGVHLQGVEGELVYPTVLFGGDLRVLREGNGEDDLPKGVGSQVNDGPLQGEALCGAEEGGVGDLKNLGGDRRVAVENLG